MPRTLGRFGRRMHRWLVSCLRMAKRKLSGDTPLVPRSNANGGRKLGGGTTHAMPHFSAWQPGRSRQGLAAQPHGQQVRACETKLESNLCRMMDIWAGYELQLANVKKKKLHTWARMLSMYFSGSLNSSSVGRKVIASGMPYGSQGVPLPRCRLVWLAVPFDQAHTLWSDVQDSEPARVWPSPYI